MNRRSEYINLEMVETIMQHSERDHKAHTRSHWNTRNDDADDDRKIGGDE